MKRHIGRAVKAQLNDKIRTQEYTFQWGVGNYFKSQNSKPKVFSPPPSNRVLKEVSLPHDYFHCNIANIKWESLNESWDVYFYENNKLSAKPFPVKKYGALQSKYEATAFFESLPASCRNMSPANAVTRNPQRDFVGKHNSIERRGLFWDEKIRSWVCQYRENGQTMSRAFSADLHGYDGAKLLAIERQNNLKTVADK